MLRGLRVLIVLIVVLWVTLLLILVAVDAILMTLVKESWLRSLLGMGLYFIWIYACYWLVQAVFQKGLERASREAKAQS